MSSLDQAPVSVMGGPLRRRQHIVLGVAVFCAVTSTGGLIASTLVKSPEQARSEVAAPPASTLTASVERRVLASTVVTRGAVVAAKNLEITPMVAGVGAQVVTGIGVRVGEDVHAGQVLVAVSGRPLITLPGTLPAYRDLKPGDSGADVRQLQDALSSLGQYRGGDKPGYFGEVTKAGIRRLYNKIGFDVPDTGGAGGAGDKAALASARDATEAARRALDLVKRRIAADEQLAATDEPWEVQLTRATEQVSRTEQNLADLIAHTGPKLPLAEFAFVSGFPARVAALSSSVGDQVRAPLITLAVGELAVMVKARPQQATLLRTGMPVQIVSETLGQQTTGVVEKIGELTSPADGAGGPFRPVTVAVSQPLPAAWSGLDVRVTITSARTTTAVLVVPLSAVSAGADGRATVSKLDPSGESTQIEVRAGASGDGFVEVSVVSGDLAEGDRVVVSAVR